jgi:hypothetical protein
LFTGLSNRPHHATFTPPPTLAEDRWYETRYSFIEDCVKRSEQNVNFDEQPALKEHFNGAEDFEL